MSEQEEKSFEFIVDRFEGSNAILVGEHNEVVVPKKMIPKNVKEGGVVHLTLSSDEAETKKRGDDAKKLLNESLNGK